MSRALSACLRAALTLLASAWLGACERSPVPAAPAAPRAVVLSPAAAASMVDLGLQGVIVGRHGFDLALDPALPVCGDQAGIDYEALLGLRPTHVVIQWGARELPPRLTNLAARHGWTIENYNPLSLAELDESTRSLARVFGVDAGRVPAVADTIRGLGPVRSGGRVLLLAGIDPPAGLGPGSFHHDMLVSLGATPALERGGPWVRLDAEDVLALRPDAILLILPRPPRTPAPPEPSPEELVGRLGRLATLDIPAVRRGRVALIDDPLAHTPSTAMIGVARAMARALERWE
jgi:ABC-type Fe3+-hydroxamate transport system substrate-binding protein